MNDLASAVERLARELEALQNRVAELERRADVESSASISAPAALPSTGTAAASAFSHGSGFLPLLGKAMLAIAGAYVLRAASAYHAMPQIPLLTLAIVYAFVWLIPAARAKAENRLASMVWAGTSAAILLPMIWELTLRFQILPGAMAASILCLYAIVAALLGWNRHFTEIAWVVEGSACMATLALAIATHNLIPFVTALLVMSAIGEIAAARHRALRVRLLLAATVDTAIFALIWVYSGPANSRSIYPAVLPSLLLMFAPLLLFLYGASASTQTILRRRGISIFETGQTLIAFLLTCWSFLAFWSGKAAIILGVLCVVASVVGYGLSFAWFGRVRAQRNYHVYATGSLTLLLAGCFLCLPDVWLAIILGAFAVGASFAALRTHYVSLRFHGLAALALIATASGLLVWCARALAGPIPGAPGGTIVLAAVAAVLCSVVFLQSSSEHWWNHLLVLTGTALGVFAAAGLLIWFVVWGWVELRAMPSLPGPQYVAVMRTAVACGVALGLAWGGSKWQRKELAWLAWTALILTAFKLLFEDLSHGYLAFTATSIFLYAVTLLLVPRLIRPHMKTENP